MRKTECYRTLFELAKRGEGYAEEVSNLIPGEALDLTIILKYHRVNNANEVSQLAGKLAKRIPKGKLDQRLLLTSQATIDYNVRQLTRTLALSIPVSLLNSDVLHEHLNHKNEYVRWLADKLMKRYILSLKSPK